MRTVVLEQNQGRVAALNAGFSAAKGQVLVRCDDDLEPGADFVSGHWARHQGQPCGVVGLTIDILPPSKYTRVYGATRTRAALAASYRGAIPSWRHWAANCSVTRETWEKIGPYDTAYQHYGWEDVDYGYRLHEAGIPVILAPELETLHHGAATDTVKRAMRAYHSGAARRTFDQLHPGVIDPVASGGGWWGKLVGAVASRTNEESTEQLANFTDSAIGVLPVPFATKLVALNVEAASLSGYCHSEQVNARF